MNARSPALVRPVSRFGTFVWGGLAMLGLAWPARVLSTFDGLPLDQPGEAVIIGVLVPVLWWLHPQWLSRSSSRLIVVMLIAWKVGTWFLLTQGGLSAQFLTETPIHNPGMRVQQTSRIQQSWDVRTGWPYSEPTASAIVSRPYDSYAEFPMWFSNLEWDLAKRPPRGNYLLNVGGYLTVPQSGLLSLPIGAAMQVAGTVDDHQVDSKATGTVDVPLGAGIHRLDLALVLAGESWRFSPTWNGRSLYRKVLTTVTWPSAVDRIMWRIGSLVTLVLVALLSLGWTVAAFRGYRPNPAMVSWIVGASSVLAFLGWVTSGAPASAGAQLSRYAALLLFGSLAVPVRRRLKNLRGAFLILGVPWLSFFIGKSATQIGRFAGYVSGDDDYAFQIYGYRIFMEKYWLEGGQETFWFQPLYRWIAGCLHVVFGDSSVGEVYWDSIGLAIGAFLAFQVLKQFAGFRMGLFAAATTLATFAVSSIWWLIGRGLSEICAAAFAYLAGFYILRGRLGRVSSIVMAGVFGTLAFYSRLNLLIFVTAMLALTLPLGMPANTWPPWRVVRARRLLRVVAIYGAVLTLGVALFALRTWYYTGVFSVLYGTQGAALSLGADPAKMLSSILMVITLHDPPRLNLLADPRGSLVVLGSICSVLAVLRVPGAGRLPLAPSVVCLGGLAFALFVRGSAYPGRFSVHIVPVATSIAVCVVALVFKRIAPRSRSVASLAV